MSQKEAINTIFYKYLDIEQENFYEKCSKVDKEVFATEFKSHILCALVIAQESKGSADELMEELWEVWQEVY